MKLTQLRYFQAVCQTGSIARATEILHITQPSVSVAIRELEEEFSVLLFTREGRGLRLTKEGSVLLAQANELLRHTDQVENVMHNIGKEKKVLNIGVPPMIGSLILPVILAEYQSKNDIRLIVTEAGRSDLLAGLEKRILDAAFLPHDLSFSDTYQSVRIAQVETVFVTSRGGSFCDVDEVTFEDLSKCRFVMFKGGFYQNEIIVNNFKKRRIQPDIVLETDQLSTLLSLVRKGIACGFLFRNIVASYQDICPVSISPRINQEISLFWNGDAYLSNEMVDFIKYAETLTI